ncbi:MAG: TauD/TfdA family dioxygenase [Crocinitomicaceae bacterium]|nr:TauD/TfdA family dioxygenase [Crocinitomicaceae bacterium]MBT6515438.1 TauD/TfdA family dioxygenase [Crocinitomicaceae bacterium]
MTEKKYTTNYDWPDSGPSPELIERAVPIRFIKNCPNLIAEDYTVDKESIQFDANKPFFNDLFSWTSKQINSLTKSPGVLLFKLGNYHLTDKQLKSLYYAIAQGLGQLNSRYGELFEVRDRNLDHTKEAIPVSKTSASTGFHTDSTALSYSPDIVGLLCLQPAEIGGESIFANAHDLLQWMQNYYPESVQVLSEPIIRDVITPGSKADIEAIKKNRFPVFSFDNDLFQFRYMRYWIITGHQRSQTFISPELIKALDRIDEYFQIKDNLFYYKMEQGDMLFINNHFICHNRTKYEDNERQGKKRTLLRTWINL